MKIRTPAKRAYYPASPNEKTRLVCWMSRKAMQQMVREGQIPATHLEDYPDGLEVEVTEAAFEDFGISLNVHTSSCWSTKCYRLREWWKGWL